MTEWFCIACARHHANQAPAVEKQLLPSGVMLRACDRLLEPYADTIRDHVARASARRVILGSNGKDGTTR